MKLIISLAILSFWPLSLLAQYKTLSPSFILGGLNQVQATSDSTIYYIDFLQGRTGTFIQANKTNDDFSTPRVPISLFIKNFNFRNDSVGFVFTPRIIQRTMDGGQTWLSFGDSLDLYTLSENNSSIVSDSLIMVFPALAPNEAIAVTEDSSWNIYSDSNSHIERIHFITADIGFLSLTYTTLSSVEYRILKTVDQGSNWTNVLTRPAGGRVKEMDFIDSLKGYVLQYNDSILFTSDGGNSWFSLNNPSSYRTNDISFYNDSVGYISCDSGEVFRTNDRGINWQSELTPSNSNLKIAGVIDEDVAYFYEQGGFVVYKRDALTTSIEEILIHTKSSFIDVYPNPSYDKIRLSLYNEEELPYVEIYNLEGVKVLSGYQKEFNISGLEDGLYVLKIKNQNTIRLGKFIKTSIK